MTLAQVDLDVFNQMGERLQLARSTLRLLRSYVTLTEHGIAANEEGGQAMVNACWEEVLRALDVWDAIDRNKDES